MKYIVLTATFLLLHQSLPAQVLMAKLKPEYLHYLKGDSIQHPRLRTLMHTLGIAKSSSVLKKHESNTSLTGVVRLQFREKENGPALVKALEQSGYFIFVEEQKTTPNTPMHRPNDPFAQPDTGKQDYLARIHAYEAWDITKGDPKAFICVIDNGLDWNHIEFKNKIYFNLGDTLDGLDNDNDGYTDNYIGWDFANMDPFPEDTTGSSNHGTEVAGVATAQSNNGFGIASVGYNTKVMPLKIFGSQGNDYDAIIYAAQHGCKVINLSWGSPGSYDQYEQAVINYAAVSHDAVLVGATWPQEQEGIYTYPADYDNVISVVALNSSNGKAYPQTFHYWTDISAPGDNVLTSIPRNSFGYNSGTSLSTPMVSGAAALVRAKYPWMNSSQVQALLRLTTSNIDTVGNNKNYLEKMGHGMLNVYRALTDSVPSIEMINYTMKRLKSDTFNIQFNAKNILWPTKNLQLSIRSITKGLGITDSTAYIGALGMGDSTGTAFSDIKFRILPYTTQQYDLVRIGIDDPSINFHDYLYFYLDKKRYIDILTSVPEQTEESPSIRVYPNPSTQFIFVEGEGMQEASIQDMLGNTVLKKTNEASIFPFDLTDQPAGIYVAKVRTSTQTYSYKFLKE